jgi:hypothetical protein
MLHRSSSTRPLGFVDGRGRSVAAAMVDCRLTGSSRPAPPRRHRLRAVWEIRELFRAARDQQAPFRTRVVGANPPGGRIRLYNAVRLTGPHHQRASDDPA